MPAEPWAGTSISAGRPQGEADSDRQGPALPLLLNGLTGHMPGAAGPISLSHRSWGQEGLTWSGGVLGPGRRFRSHPSRAPKILSHGFEFAINLTPRYSRKSTD